MLAPVLRSVLLRDRQRVLATRASEYSGNLDGKSIESLQVTRFNRVWSYCLESVPFYQEWAREHALPDYVSTVADLRAFPVLTKADVVGRSDLAFQSGKITAAYSTGGTSGEPARFPRGENDTADFYANTYTGRSWWGIRPFDSYVHLWGHSHLFGGSPLARVKRGVSDRFANATRLNAYDMTPEAIARHVEALLKRNPTYLVGYTSAVFRLARHMEGQSFGKRLSRLRAVIVTAETVTGADVDIIERVFGVPVVIEYGAAETGVMATSRGGSWPLQVMWGSFIVRVAGDAGDLVLTTLNDRLFPLVNYSIGDQATVAESHGDTVLSLDSISGRAKDVVQVRAIDGSVLELSAILPIHALKSEPGILAVQFRQEPNGTLRVFVTADGPLDLGALGTVFSSRMLLSHPSFDPESVVLEQSNNPVLTKAGKHSLFVP